MHFFVFLYFVSFPPSTPTYPTSSLPPPLPHFTFSLLFQTSLSSLFLVLSSLHWSHCISSCTSVSSFLLSLHTHQPSLILSHFLYHFTLFLFSSLYLCFFHSMDVIAFLLFPLFCLTSPPSTPTNPSTPPSFLPHFLFNCTLFLLHLFLVFLPPPLPPTGMCQMLASMRTDKCLLSHLSPGQMESRTCQLFQECIIPLLSFLKSIEQHSSQSGPGHTKGTYICFNSKLCVCVCVCVCVCALPGVHHPPPQFPQIHRATFIPIWPWPHQRYLHLL